MSGPGNAIRIFQHGVDERLPRCIPASISWKTIPGLQLGHRRATSHSAAAGFTSAKLLKLLLVSLFLNIKVQR